MVPFRSAVRFALAVVGLVALALPLAVFLPSDPLTTVRLRAVLAVGVSLPLAGSYALERRSLARLAAFVLTVQFLSMTLVPGFVLGYAVLAALRSVPDGAALVGLLDRLSSAFRPLGTTVLVVSRYGLAYYVVYCDGRNVWWLPR